MKERVVDAANTNNKGKRKQDPRVPPPRKFPPPRGGQHPINIHVKNPVPITSQVDKVTTAPSTHDSTSKSNPCQVRTEYQRPALSDLEGIFGSETEEIQEPNHRRRQKKKQEFFRHASLRGSDESRAKALVGFFLF